MELIQKEKTKTGSHTNFESEIKITEVFIFFHFNIRFFLFYREKMQILLKKIKI